MISRDILKKRFKFFIVLSLFILALELGGSVFTNSLALLSDAGHILVDIFALSLAYFSMHLSKRRPTKKFTYGYYRAEILTAIINGIAIIGITIYIFYQAYMRFLTPEAIRGPEMLVIAIIGLIANLYIIKRMQGYEKENLNVRGAYLHVLSDMLSSIGVVIAGILIIVTGSYIFDPIISVMIGIFILLSSFRLIKESTHILMEGVPKHVNIKRLSRDMKKIKGVDQIHDLHVWSISSDVYALSAHVLINAKNIKSMNNIVSTINKMLGEKYDITHTVIQSECENCVDIGRKH